MIPTLVCTPRCPRNPAHAVAVTTARRGRLRRERFAFEELMCPRPARGSGRLPRPQNRRASKRRGGDQRTSACLLLAREQGLKETGRRGSADRAPKSRTTMATPAPSYNTHPYPGCDCKNPHSVTSCANEDTGDGSIGILRTWCTEHTTQEECAAAKPQGIPNICEWYGAAESGDGGGGDGDGGDDVPRTLPIWQEP